MLGKRLQTEHGKLLVKGFLRNELPLWIGFRHGAARRLFAGIGNFNGHKGLFNFTTGGREQPNLSIETRSGQSFPVRRTSQSKNPGFIHRDLPCLLASVYLEGSDFSLTVQATTGKTQLAVRLEADGKNSSEHGPELSNLVGISTTCGSCFYGLPKELGLAVGATHQKLHARRVNVDRVLASTKNKRRVRGHVADKSLGSDVGLLDSLVPAYRKDRLAVLGKDRAPNPVVMTGHIYDLLAGSCIDHS